MAQEQFCSEQAQAAVFSLNRRQLDQNSRLPNDNIWCTIAAVLTAQCTIRDPCEVWVLWEVWAAVGSGCCEVGPRVWCNGAGAGMLYVCAHRDEGVLRMWRTSGCREPRGAGGRKKGCGEPQDAESLAKQESISIRSLQLSLHGAKGEKLSLPQREERDGGFPAQP